MPLLERVKFLAIFSSNLDEFFMVRVARLKRMVFEADQSVDPDGLTPATDVDGDLGAQCMSWLMNSIPVFSTPSCRN